MLFGEFLVEKGKLTTDELSSVLSLQKFRKEKLGRLLLELGKLSKSDLKKVLTDFFKSKEEKSYEELKTQVNGATVSHKTKTICEKYQLIPTGEVEYAVQVLAKNIEDDSLKELEYELQKDVIVTVIEGKFFDLLNKPILSNLNSSLVVSRDLTSDQKLHDQDPYVRLLFEGFRSAKKLGASDIHFEPYELEYLIRFRVHGKLQDWKRLDASHAVPFTSKLKWLINMDLGIIGVPQDSRGSFHSLGVEIRGSSMPVTSGGEKVVLRLQYKDKAFRIQSLGMRPSKLQILLESITKSDGLILISGPTGSGKTTTLYALLEEMDRLGKNISTLENPVERELPRINQANISDHRDFASFQRALMRQDPDVILLGEIRDSETAELSLKLASTGHLVLSTIHANGALQVVDRLTNLGADLFSIKTNLRLSVAQRLLRLICPKCSLPAPGELADKTQTGGDFKILNTKGCVACSAGVVGRKAVIECLEKEELLPLGVEPITVRETLAFECMNLAMKGEIDVRDALFFT